MDGGMQTVRVITRTERERYNRHDGASGAG